MYQVSTYITCTYICLIGYYMLLIQLKLINKKIVMIDQLNKINNINHVFHMKY
jgi:hypothetical protein